MPTGELRARIEGLAAAAAALEPTPDQRATWQAAVDRLVGEFLDGLATHRTFAPAAPSMAADLDRELDWNRDWHGKPDEGSAQDEGQTGRSLAHLLATLKDEVGRAGILTAGPGHLAFVPGGGLYLGAVADHVAAALNTFSADAFAAPAAAHINNQAVRWLTGLVGYGEDAWGDITSGGSQATLTALYVARQARAIHPGAYATTCVYLGEHTHHCCKKALDVLFAGDLLIRQVPSRDHAMDDAALAKLVAADLAAGLQPWLVVATAGSTNLGRVDPLAKIAAVAKRHHMWLHVDGAYGGFFKLCPEAAPLLAGTEAADSVVLDPHKGMFLPYGTGAALFKDGTLLRRAVAGTGSYLQDRSAETEQLRSPMDYSLELSRPFRSLRLWLTLALHGEGTLTSALSEKLLLARHAYERLAAIDHITMVGPPDLSIFAFYYQPTGQGEDGNRCTKDLLGRINKHGEVFLSSTVVGGRFVIRVAVLSFRTHLATIDALVRIVAEAAAQVSASAAHPPGAAP